MGCKNHKLPFLISLSIPMACMRIDLGILSIMSSLCFPPFCCSVKSAVGVSNNWSLSGCDDKALTRLRVVPRPVVPASGWTPETSSGSFWNICTQGYHKALILSRLLVWRSSSNLSENRLFWSSCQGNYNLLPKILYLWRWFICYDCLCGRLNLLCKIWIDFFLCQHWWCTVFGAFCVFS